MYVKVMAGLLLVVLAVPNVIANAISLEDLVGLPNVSNPVLSPNGKSIALAIKANGKPLLVIKNLDPSLDKSFPAVGVPLVDSNINWYRWATDDRLIISVKYVQKGRGKNFFTVTRLMSVSRDGKDIVTFDMRPNSHGYFLLNPEVVSWLPDDPEHILARLDADFILPSKDNQIKIHQQAQVPIHKVNIYSGKRQIYYSNKNRYDRLFADEKGNFRLAVKDGFDNGQEVALYARKSIDAPFNKVLQTGFFDSARIHPIRIDDHDPNFAVVVLGEMDEFNFHEEDEKLRYFDLVKQEVVGEYVDRSYQPVKSIFQKRFPGKRVYKVSESRSKGRYVVKILSDVTVPEYYLFDVADNSMVLLASERPALKEMTLSSTTEYNYTAQDGFNIPAYLTLPTSVKQKKPALVVLPHDGPWKKEPLTFNKHVQFFASRGYAVFQPQYRGTRGYGVEHLRKGFRELGGKMQMDIADGVRKLIEDDIVDANKICIVGQGFGGYSAVYGLYKTPDLYRCAVSIDGILDVKRDYRGLSTQDKKITYPDIGLKKISPYHQSKHITKPILLIAGLKNSIIPYQHSEDFYKKNKKVNDSLEYLRIKNGEHWATNDTLEIKKFKAIEGFLKEHLH